MKNNEYPKVIYGYAILLDNNKKTKSSNFLDKFI